MLCPSNTALWYVSWPLGLSILIFVQSMRLTHRSSEAPVSWIVFSYFFFMMPWKHATHFQDIGVFLNEHLNQFPHNLLHLGSDFLNFVTRSAHLVVKPSIWRTAQLAVFRLQQHLFSLAFILHPTISAVLATSRVLKRWFSKSSLSDSTSELKIPWQFCIEQLRSQRTSKERKFLQHCIWSTFSFSTSRRSA